MNDRCHAQRMGNARNQTARDGPRWLVIAAVRPWVLPMFEARGSVRDNHEPDWRRHGKPTDRTVNWSRRDFQEDV